MLKIAKTTTTESVWPMSWATDLIECKKNPTLTWRILNRNSRSTHSCDHFGLLNGVHFTNEHIKRMKREEVMIAKTNRTTTTTAASKNQLKRIKFTENRILYFVHRINMYTYRYNYKSTYNYYCHINRAI